MICPECGAEYIAGVRVCADCGVPLVEHLPGEEPELSPMDEEVRVNISEGYYEEVYTGVNVAEINLIKSLFDDAGFDYFFSPEEPVVATEPVRIMVRRDQVEEALIVLRSLDQPET